MTLLDKILAESTLFNNLNLNSYNSLLEALKVADAKVTLELLKTKSEWSKSRLNKMKALIDQEIQIAYGGLFEAVALESVESANISYALIVGEIGASVPTSVVNELVNSNREIRMGENAYYGFKDLFKLSEENHARQLKVLLASGVTQGNSVDKIIRDYNIKSDRLSKSNIRTNINTVINQARQNSKAQSFTKLEQMGVIKGYEYNSTLDISTSDYCIRMDGKKYYKSIKEINHLMKVHANCRSEWITLTGNEVDDKKASQFGQTDANNYRTWFKDTPDWFKRAKLTKKQYEAYQKGLYEVGSLNDITKKMTLQQIKDTTDRIIKG